MFLLSNSGAAPRAPRPASRAPKLFCSTLLHYDPSRSTSLNSAFLHSSWFAPRLSTCSHIWQPHLSNTTAFTPLSPPLPLPPDLADERDKLLQEKLESVDELAELKLRLEEATEYEAQVEVLAEENAALADERARLEQACSGLRRA